MSRRVRVWRGGNLPTEHEAKEVLIARKIGAPIREMAGLDEHLVQALGNMGKLIIDHCQERAHRYQKVEMI